MDQINKSAKYISATLIIVTLGLNPFITPAEADPYQREATREYRAEITHPNSNHTRRRPNGTDRPARSGPDNESKASLIGALLGAGVLYLGCRAAGSCGAERE